MSLKLDQSQIKQLQQAVLMFPKELRLDASTMMSGVMVQNALPGANLISQMSPLAGGLDAFKDNIKDMMANKLSGELTKALGSHAGLQGIAAIGKAFQAFDAVSGIVPKLFHGNLAQVGTGNFADLMKLRQQFGNLRLHDMIKQGLGGAALKQLSALPMMDKLKTIPEIESYIWSHMFKKNGMGHIAMRSFPRTAFKGMFK